MQETDPVKDRLKDIEFGLEITLGHLLPSIGMAEIAIKPDIRYSAGQLHGAPHVLSDRRPVGFANCG